MFVSYKVSFGLEFISVRYGRNTGQQCQLFDDTDKFLKSIVDAINWEIQVVNGTLEVINAGEERLDKEAFNKAVSALAGAIKAKDDAAMAAEFQNVIPVFEKLGEIAAKVVK